MVGSAASISPPKSDPTALVSDEVLHTKPAMSKRSSCGSCGHAAGVSALGEPSSYWVTDVGVPPADRVVVYLLCIALPPNFCIFATSVGAVGNVCAVPPRLHCPCRR